MLNARKTNNRGAVVFIAFVLCATQAGVLQAENEPLVKVQAWGEHSGMDIIYHYRLMDLSAKDIRQLWVGIEGRPGDFFPELTALPVGWDPYTHETPVASTTSPDGWRMEAIGLEESRHHMLFWEISDTDAGREGGIQPGQVVDSFSVRLPEIDTGHVKGHFFVRYEGWKTFSGVLEQVDAIPPNIKVTLSPARLWPPNGKVVNIAAQVTATDDYDGQPEIHLESITANEPVVPGKDIVDAQYGMDDRHFGLRAWREGQSAEGRTYTVTYSATDASGNRAMASTTVVVPHDQGNVKEAP